MLLLARIGSSGSPIVYIMIPGLLTAAGIALSIVPSTIAATQGAKEGQAGLASGLVNTSRQIGGGLGLAVLITLATQHTSHLIGAGALVPQALTDGFRLAYLIGAGLAAAAALVTFTAMPKPDGAPRVGSPAGTRDRRGAGGLRGGRSAPSRARTARRSAPTRPTAPTASCPRRRCIRRSCNTTARRSPAQLAPGYIFTANFYNLNYPPLVGQSGPLILDHDLQPVWFQPVPEKVVASNLSLQTYDGKPALAWWQGVVTNTGQTESGEYVVVNQHYQPVAPLKGERRLGLHAPRDRDQRPRRVGDGQQEHPEDLSRYGGAYNGALIDSAVQEYNLKTGKLLSSWDALDHIPLERLLCVACRPTGSRGTHTTSTRSR